jgi:hypothetical protein
MMGHEAADQADEAQEGADPGLMRMTTDLEIAAWHSFDCVV